MTDHDREWGCKENLALLPEKTCTCVRCDTCHGSGRVWIHDPIDFADSIQCEWCDGGITEVCDRCLEMEQDYE